jgi:hypothetical protein
MKSFPFCRDADSTPLRAGIRHSRHSAVAQLLEEHSYDGWIAVYQSDAIQPTLLPRSAQKKGSGMQKK